MDIQISGLMNTITSKVDSYKSKLLTSETLDFSNYLKDNYESVDKDKNGLLSKDEVVENIKKTTNPELQKLLDNKNVERVISNIDKNSDALVSMNELNINSNKNDSLMSAGKKFNTVGIDMSNFTLTANNLTQKLCQNSYVNAALTSFAKSAVSYVL